MAGVVNLTASPTSQLFLARDIEPLLSSTFAVIPFLRSLPALRRVEPFDKSPRTIPATHATPATLLAQWST